MANKTWNEAAEFDALETDLLLAVQRVLDTKRRFCIVGTPHVHEILQVTNREGETLWLCHMRGGNDYKFAHMVTQELPPKWGTVTIHLEW